MQCIIVTVSHSIRVPLYQCRGVGTRGAKGAQAPPASLQGGALPLLDFNYILIMISMCQSYTPVTGN